MAGTALPQEATNDTGFKSIICRLNSLKRGAGGASVHNCEQRAVLSPCWLCLQHHVHSQGLSRPIKMGSYVNAHIEDISDAQSLFRSMSAMK